MTDLDMLRRALRVSDGDGYSTEALNVREITTLGKRLRRRRRLAAVGAGLCVAAAVFGAATGITHLTRPSSAPAQYPVSPGRTVPGPSRCHPVPSPTGISTSTPAAVPSPTGAGAGTPTAVPSATPPVPSPTGAGAETPTTVPSPTTPVPSPTGC